MDKKIIHYNKSTDKTYISKTFPQYKIVPDYKGGSQQVFEDNQRIISKVIDSEVQYTFAQVKDEVIIRKTDKGRQEIRATVFEESRSVTVLTFQRYTGPSGKPHETSFSFIGDEIGTLYDFLDNLSYLPITSESASSIKDTELDNVIKSKDGLSWDLYLRIRKFYYSSSQAN